MKSQLFPTASTLRFAFIIMALTLTSVGEAATADPDATLFDETKVTTLFAFDNVSIPFTQNLRVKMRKPEKHPGNPVVARGPAGSVDAWAVQFYGSLIRERGKFRIWYAAVSDLRPAGTDTPRWRPALAESADGIHWTKPNLGLVEHSGNKNNNLLRIDPPQLSFLNLKVLHEPDEPNPERRYKMTTHAYFSKQSTLGTLVPFFSPDGLNWKTARPVTPVGTEIGKVDMFLPWTHFEAAGGLYKWDGLYYASGQNAIGAAEPFHGRIARAYISSDFITWAHANAVNFTRDAQHHLLGPGRSRDGEQTHEGVSAWNRHNALLGVHGIWHGSTEWKNVTIDLGFLISNDGIAFREPANEFVFVERGRDGAWDQGGLLQGQGFENVGSQTYVYYGSWDSRAHQHSDRLPPRGGIGLVTLPRDRFGDLVVDPSGIGDGAYQIPADEAVCEFMTKSIDLNRGSPARLNINVDGLGSDARLRIELLKHDLSPLPGFSGKDASVVDQNGFQTEIMWHGRALIENPPERIRIRVIYEGKRRDSIRVSALYVRN